MYRTFDNIEQALRRTGTKKTVALANAQDEPALAALVEARRHGIAEGTLVGNRKQILPLLSRMGEDPASYRLVDADTEQDAAHIAASLVHSGEADLPMKGLMHTSTFMRAILDKQEGFVPKDGLLSQCTVLEWTDRKQLLAITDCAVNIAPGVDDKAKIIANAVAMLRQFGYDHPRVAVVSALEVVNPKIPSTVEADELARMSWANCVVQGPFALDNAISEEAAAHKGISGEVAGRADVLVMPDLCTGNVFSKSLTFFAKLKSAGVLLGTTSPVIMTSRTDSPENKYFSILASIAMA